MPLTAKVSDFRAYPRIACRDSYNPAVHRFFAPTLDPGDETVALPREEAEHLTRVLRLGTGDTVAVFDGRGHEFTARVTSAIRRDVRLQIVSRLEPAAESDLGDLIFELANPEISRVLTVDRAQWWIKKLESSDSAVVE